MNGILTTIMPVCFLGCRKKLNTSGSIVGKVSIWLLNQVTMYHTCVLKIILISFNNDVLHNKQQYITEVTLVVATAAKEELVEQQ